MAGATERVFVAPPIPTGGGKVIAAPFQFYTTGEDNLRVVSVNSLTGVSLVIQGRLVDNVGKLQAASWSHTPNTNRTTKTTEIALAAGAVLNLTVFANAGSPSVGQTFVMVQLIRGTGAAAIVLGTLLQGYVTSTQSLAWPGSPLISSTDGEPALRFIIGTTPAVGANFAETCPTGARWELIQLFSRFVASAAVGTRTPELAINGNNGAASGGIYVTSTGIGPNTNWFLTWAQSVGAGSAGSASSAFASIPSRCMLKAGDQFVSVTPGIDVNDTWTAPQYYVREWLEVN